MDPDSSLTDLFQNALVEASKASNLPTIEDDTQDLLNRILEALREIAKRVELLSLFSPNETLEDVSTKNLPFLSVPYVLAEIEGRVRTNGRQERFARIRSIQDQYHAFHKALHTYEIVPEPLNLLYSKWSTKIADPAKQRELKIKQYKREKEFRSKINEIRKRQGQEPAPSESTDFDHIASLLLQTGTGGKGNESEWDEHVRELSIHLLRLFWIQAWSQLDSLDQEIELLRNAPPSPRSGPQTTTEKDADAWRLDAPPPTGVLDSRGPLIDQSGKPLRPFTILPGGATDRVRLQGEVFRPDHRLPTMSVDQYLEIERQRGKIITGGGPQSEKELTTSERLALDAENEGSIFGEEKQEEKRQKDESWARYTDTHPKGAGNRMNRG
ncbi:hypothetical protein BDM02DRAFT_3178726 [Thelephora ganbajun]|uniref:Uncharacterized protein n=1 Tax=Thelephora ganbajun TaxID=370292 RepID=A0ACB6ZQP4_THEGA|nr:hypothetical protein BDM02DRAFT_3178726 [Thelephora ganbajun]